MGWRLKNVSISNFWQTHQTEVVLVKTHEQLGWRCAAVAVEI